MFKFTGSIVKTNVAQFTDWSRAGSISVFAKDKHEADKKVIDLMGDAGARFDWQWKWHEITEEKD